MELTVLVDNKKSPDSCLLSEHGLSFFIEEEKTKLLFDCGSSDAFIKNAYDMQIELAKVTDIILSHGHLDHIGGFLRLQALYEEFEKEGLKFDAKRVLAHPDVFKPEDGEIYHGETFTLNADEIQKFFNLALTKDAKFITSQLIYLGEIPIKYENKKMDTIPEETALAFKSKDGLIILSGCSHSGVKNIIEHAKYVTGTEKINTLIGGIYLIDQSEEYITELGIYLQSQGIERIYPCHCTDFEAKAILSKYVQVEDVCTGKKYNWE